MSLLTDSLRVHFLSTGTDYDIGRHDITFRSTTFQGAVDIDFIIEHDELVEGHEVVYLSLTQPVITGLDHPNGAVLGATRNTIVTISDDDGEYVKHTVWHLTMSLISHFTFDVNGDLHCKVNESWCKLTCIFLQKSLLGSL